MTERVVNLDNNPRPAVTVQISGKSFTIRRIVTGVRQLWKIFVKETIELLEILDKVRPVTEANDQKIEQKTEEMTQLAVRIDEFHESKLERLLRILELLLIKNGYDFDREWWIENGSELDYKEFIEAVLLNESAEPKKKDGDVQEESTGPG